MSKNDKDKIKGIVATVIFHALIFLALIFASLYYSFPPKEDELAMLNQDEILFGGEYVVLGDFIQPTQDNVSGAPQEMEQNENPTIEGTDEINSGEIGEAPTQTITQESESPMKVKKEENPGPTAEELAAEAERVRKEKEAAERINKRVSFGNTTGSGSGSTGSTTGSNTARVASGAPGVSGLEGYTLASWGRPNSPVQGVVKIQVRVNSRGKVISANYAGGSGSAAGNLSVRRSCEQASLKSQFSVPKNTTTEGVGMITWRFE